jgi:uncharacterized membrane protein
MAKVIVSKRVDASIAEVWASWDDYGNIDRFNPSITRSYLVTDDTQPTRVGSKRHCDLADGKNWLREEVIAYEPKQSLKIDIYDGSMPLNSAVATFEFESIAPERTRVRMTMEFEPKFGVLGRLMEPLMKRQFAPMLQAMLDGNAAYVERGVEVPRAA